MKRNNNIGGFCFQHNKLDYFRSHKSVKLEANRKWATNKEKNVR